jgi:hypothetical protein
MKINNTRSFPGIVQYYPRIIVDTAGEPQLAIAMASKKCDAYETDWVVKLEPHEVSILISLIGRWGILVGKRMREHAERTEAMAARIAERPAGVSRRIERHGGPVEDDAA